MASHSSKPSQKEVEWGQGCHSWSPWAVYKFLCQLSCSVNPYSEKLNSRKPNQNKIKNYDVSQYLSNSRYHQILLLRNVFVTIPTGEKKSVVNDIGSVCRQKGH